MQLAKVFNQIEKERWLYGGRLDNLQPDSKLSKLYIKADELAGKLIESQKQYEKEKSKSVPSYPLNVVKNSWVDRTKEQPRRQHRFYD